MQDQPEEEEIPEWLDPIYDEEDPKEFMQAELDATPEREAAAKAAMERLSSTSTRPAAPYLFASGSLSAAPGSIRGSNRAVSMAAWRGGRWRWTKRQETCV